jgi:hypothetical protein
MLHTIKQVSSIGKKHPTIKKAREQMLGGMFDADVQSRWRDSCAMDCGRNEMQTKI